jgi:hypothetical protein
VIQLDLRVCLHVLPDEGHGAVPAASIDDDYLERLLLGDQAVKKVPYVALLVQEIQDDAYHHCVDAFWKRLPHIMICRFNGPAVD